MIKTGKKQNINNNIFTITELPENHTFDYKVIKHQNENLDLIDTMCEGDAEYCEEWIIENSK